MASPNSMKQKKAKLKFCLTDVKSFLYAFQKLKEYILYASRVDFESFSYFQESAAQDHSLIFPVSWAASLRPARSTARSYSAKTSLSSLLLNSFEMG